MCYSLIIEREEECSLTGGVSVTSCLNLSGTTIQDLRHLQQVVRKGGRHALDKNEKARRRVVVEGPGYPSPQVERPDARFVCLQGLV
jgi:hypothetical protein